MKQTLFALFTFIFSAFISLSLSAQTTIDIWEDDALVTEDNIVELVEKASFSDKMIRSFLNVAGEKKSWLKDEVDVKKKRRFDLREPKPKFFSGFDYESFDVLKTKVTSLKNEESNSGKLAMYFHGGAFIMGPVKMQWQMLRKLAEGTGQEIWMVDYPKAPEVSVEEIYENAFATYQKALETHKPEDITVMGGSSGGNVALSVLTRIKQEGMAMPSQAIVYSPFIDYASDNPDIEVVDKRDPVLARPGLELVAELMDLQEDKVTDPLYSPIYGDLRNFPKLHMFVASDDILMPDELRFFDKAVADGVDITLYLGNGMVHCWPIIPNKTGRKAVEETIAIMNRTVEEETTDTASGN